MVSFVGGNDIIAPVFVANRWSNLT